jgi:molybdopterin-guanine dinucleotide biosynthesis protein MobB
MMRRVSSYIPTISFIGHSGSGKTTLLEKLIPELVSRGYRITVAKHVGESVELDTPTKDTWRFSRAGAHAVIISMVDIISVISKSINEDTLAELQRAAGPLCDLLLIEGHKHERGAKIEVRRSPDSKPLSAVPDLCAIVSAHSWKEAVPRFEPSDVPGIADFIEKRFLNSSGEQVAMFINGQPFKVSPSIAKKLIQTSNLLISPKSEVPKIRNIELWLKLRN